MEDNAFLTNSLKCPYNNVVRMLSIFILNANKAKKSLMLQTVNYKLIYANSLLVALFIAQTCIVSVINSFLTIPKISVIISLILFFVAISLNRNTKFCKQVVISYALIFLLLSFSLIVNGVESCIDYILHYIVFGTTAFVLSNIPLNGKIIINSSIYIYIVYLIVFF